jgi:multidrug efflux pump subunit AcrB
MNLTRASLRRPITVMVAVLAVCLGGWMAIQRMARDVFPPLGIPTIYVAQPFGGMDPAQMEGFLTFSTSRASSTWSRSPSRARR